MKEAILKFKEDKVSVCFECSDATEKLILLAFLNVCGYEVDAISKSLYENDDKALLVRIFQDLKVMVDLYIPNVSENRGCCNVYYLFEDFKFECSYM